MTVSTTIRRWTLAGLAALLLPLLWIGTNGACAELDIVTWVDDGDTILMQNGKRIRYIGINTPEVAHKARPGKPATLAEPHGDDAAKRNRQLVQGRTVRLEFDKELRDRYGRHLAYVYTTDGVLVNEQLLREGLAYCLPLAPNRRHEKRLLTAQQGAMESMQGMWKKRRDISGQKTIANRRSKRFHRESCPYGRNIARGNRIFFESEWNAFFQGFAPGKKCLGPGASREAK